MKTLKDFEQMKTEKSIPFGTQYDYFIARLEDYYIAKQDGFARIKSKLSQWDEEAQKVIIQILVETIYNNGIVGLNKQEITVKLRLGFYNPE